MANNQVQKSTFDVNSFISKTLYRPLVDGEYRVTLGEGKIISDKKKDGTDTAYLLLPLTFDNGRISETRHYNWRMEAIINQLRQQFKDTKDYKNVFEFLKVYENRKATVWVSHSEYIDDTNVVRHGIEFNFTPPPPKEVTTDTLV
jgi:plasmid replication initiation protein